MTKPTIDLFACCAEPGSVRVRALDVRSPPSISRSDAVPPETAIISAGVDNAYGHPSEEVVDRLLAADMIIWQTDLGDGDDTLMLTSDCQGSYDVEHAYQVE